jgi:hypothetical protein
VVADAGYQSGTERGRLTRLVTTVDLGSLRLVESPPMGMDAVENRTARGLPRPYPPYLFERRTEGDRTTNGTIRYAINLRPHTEILTLPLNPSLRLNQVLACE